MTTAIAIITPAEIQSAGAILTQNTGWVEMYKRKQERLIAKAKAEGVKLSPETDAELDSFIVSSKIALKKMKEDREPFTRKMTEIQKQYTSLENEIEKVLNPEIQTLRDNSAAVYARELRDKEAAAAAKLRKDQERIQLIAEAEQHVREGYASILNGNKAQILEYFEQSNDETIIELENMLNNTEPTLKVDRWDAIQPSLKSLHGNDIPNIILNAKLGKYDLCADHYKKEMTAYMEYILSLVPERKEEIKAGLQSEAAEKLKKEQADAQEAQANASADATAKQVHVAIEQAKMESKIEVLSAKADAPRIADSYVINVLNRDGWMQLFQFYFERSTEEDLGKIKGDQMKTFAEKMAKSDGLFIEHESIEYEEKFKAVSGRAKKAA